MQHGAMLQIVAWRLCIDTAPGQSPENKFADSSCRDRHTEDTVEAQQTTCLSARCRPKGLQCAESEDVDFTGPIPIEAARHSL